MRTLTLLTYFFLHLNSFSQHFEWAATASNVDINYDFASVSSDNEIVVGGNGGQSSNHYGKKIEIYDANGEVKKDRYSIQNGAFLISYTSDGEINWQTEFSSRAYELFGLTHDHYGNLNVLLYVSSPYTFRNKQHLLDQALVDTIQSYQNEIDLDELITGYYILTLNDKGKEVSYHKVLDGNQYQFHISDFTAYPSGGFVISGFTNPGKFHKDLPDTAGTAGGNFIYKVSEDYTADWVDVVSHLKESCCSITDSYLSVAPDGTIYLGSSFYMGGSFNHGKKKMMSKQKYDTSSYLKPLESYIASYSPKGKLNWVRISKSKAYLKSIVANNSGVVICYNPFETNQAFGQKFDTSDQKLMVVSSFNATGDLKWTETMGADMANDMQFDSEGNLYLLGTFRAYSQYFKRSGIIGTDTLDDKSDIFICRYTKEGEFNWLKSANIPISTRNNRLTLLMDNCGNMVVTGSLFFGLPGQMSWWDKAFVKGNGYGGAPFISRFINTLPKQHEKQEVCTISPGPWEIKAFPNPFQSSTTLQYTTTYDDQVSIELYSLNGKMIQQLQAPKQQSAGNYTLQVQLGNHSAGTYLLVIKGTEMIATRRLLKL